MYIVEVDEYTWGCGDGCCGRTDYTVSLYKNDVRELIHAWETSSSDLYEPQISNILTYVNQALGEELLTESNFTLTITYSTNLNNDDDESED